MKDTASVANEQKSVRIYFSTADHAMLKEVARIEGMTMSGLVRRVMLDYIFDDKNRERRRAKQNGDVA